MSSTLQKKLRVIENLFIVENILAVKSNPQTITKYYKINKIPYTIFHTGQDFIHMGISKDGKYKRADLLEHAKLVERYIRQTNARSVLELATGRGATSAYLAKKYPAITFQGLDLPDGQIDYAFKKARRLKNFLPAQGDFHDLHHFPPDSFDIVFVIEALCYSIEKEKALKQVKRILKKGGAFIIFDGYAKKPLATLTAEEKLAKELTEKGMVVESFAYYPDFKKKLVKAEFTIIYEEDASLHILPTLKRFEKQAQFIFSIPLLPKLLLKLLPSEFANNGISGYLMPTLIQNGVACYEILVVQKK